MATSFVASSNGHDSDLLDPSHQSLNTLVAFGSAQRINLGHGE